MDYEKKDFRKLYEDLVKSDWFKRAYHNRSLGECPFDIPELSESEDERARKFLVKHVSEWIGCIEHDLKLSSKDVESEEELAMFKACLAYLEKQKSNIEKFEDISTVLLIKKEIERRLQRENEILWNAKKRGTYPSPSCEYNLLTLTSLRDFIDSLPEEDPLNDQRFGEGFDAGRAVQRIFDETEEKPSEDLEKAASRLGFDYVDNIVHESPEHRWNDHDVEFGYRDGFIAGAEWAMHYQEKKIADAYDKGKQEGIRVVRSWESSPGQCGY